MSIYRIYTLAAAEGKASQLQEFLQELGTDVRAISGCEDYQVFRNTEPDGDFVLMERWTSKQAHEASAEFFPKDKMKKAAALFGGPPTGGYYHGQ